PHLSSCQSVFFQFPCGRAESLRTSKETFRNVEGSRVLSEERRREILRLLRSNRRVLVRDLSRRFRTSLITIRKDLESLHHRRLLERTHGGALPLPAGALQDPSLEQKERLHRREKVRIANAATRMIRPDQVVILDSGTTTTAIARGCCHLRGLTIIT